MFKASSIDPNPRTPFRRIYSFRDVVNLRALARIRRDARVPFTEVLEASRYLAEHYASPWSELRFGLLDGRLVFRDPETREWSHASGQHVLELSIEGIPAEIRNALPEMMTRDASTYGVITRNRYVQHNRPVIAGTRIPTSSVQSLHDAGYTTAQILDEYPHLTVDDIAAALAFESEARHVA